MQPKGKGGEPKGDTTINELTAKISTEKRLANNAFSEKERVFKYRAGQHRDQVL